ncbi:prepilin-type N-terminal cleavage/methylation domain-containing protein [Leifsonia sp. NPDC058248]|uniref:type IV pilus modification PilV family protein n=1 Tax=Leifsonia sp. NPDC058248 TaxID=3346402 RepID=UPI0036DAE1CE
MKALRASLRTARDPEAGVSLIEVIVAMMIFAIISVGVAYALLSSFAITNDSRSRAVATNLAAQEIDLDRSAADIFALQSTLDTAPKTVQVPSGAGITYSIERDVSWVYNSGSDVDCNASAASSLLYKRIHVSITWPKMVGAPVVADTLFAPSSKISVDTLGTILVSTKSATGAPVSGVSVSVSPNPGSTPVATDIMGCSYVVKVPAGTYTVSISKAGFIDPLQKLAPSRTVTVTAGTSTSAGFTYDQAGTVGLTYPSGGVQIPNNLIDTFSSSNGVYSSPATTPSSLQLFPSTQYDAFAGAFVAKTDTNAGCISPDSGQWPDTTDGLGHTLSAPAPQTISFDAGANISAQRFPMGTVTVTNVAGTLNNLFLVATSAAPFVAGDPGCTGKPQSLAFTTTLGKSKGSNLTLALPYGAWTLAWGTSANPTTVVPSSNLSAPSGATGTKIGLAGAFTLDPRVVVP